MQLGIENYGVPTKDQKENLGKHKLSDLLKDLEDSSMKFGFEAPPAELKKLVDIFIKIEKSDTWSRYEKSIPKKGQAAISHIADEVALPVAELQERLEKTIILIKYKPGDDEVYEYPLYEEWLSLARATGSAG